jgi:mycofactocin glycosyltransferase
LTTKGEIVIPLTYRLRKEVRFERRDGSFLVISNTPLSVVRVSERAASILRSCDGRKNVALIAAEVTSLTEEQIFRIFDYFNKKGVLEPVQTKNEGYYPPVTVIIPAKDRAEELKGCLESVFTQEYPTDMIEVIVIDDGSRDETAGVARSFPCKLFSLEKSRGQSFCRNLGAGVGKGEILAFLDSDCIAAKTWLRDLVPLFQWGRVGAVGGRVDGYFEESGLDRYENAFSSLSMGKHMIYGSNDESLVYAPTCNLLTRKTVYAEIGGIRDGMHVGEDVDFCWRMRARGHALLYVPFGNVKHKHRNRLLAMLKRRLEYGTSEGALYRLHPRKKKVLPVPVASALAFAGLCASIVFLSLLPLPLCLACFLFDAASKTVRTGRMGIRIPLRKVAFSVVRTYLSFFYFVSFHLVRYYLVPILLVGFAFRTLWLLVLFFLFLSSAVDYQTKRPALTYPGFLFFYVLEHVSYQTGVFLGCVKARTFGSYRMRLLIRFGK